MFQRELNTPSETSIRKRMLRVLIIVSHDTLVRQYLKDRNVAYSILSALALDGDRLAIFSQENQVSVRLVDCPSQRTSTEFCSFALSYP
jgi:hypothetical protein